MVNIETHYGDIVNSTANYICHQVNCRGAMNSGVAKAIREKWPQVYEAYSEKINASVSVGEPAFDLGTIQVVALYEDYYKVKFHPCVINMFSQYDYGYDGKKYTSYDAFWECLQQIHKGINKEEKIRIAFPYKIGCGRGGANWNVIYNMIITTFDDCDFLTIEFWKLEENKND